jgi:Zn-dependent protease with chaperone function
MQRDGVVAPYRTVASKLLLTGVPGALGQTLILFCIGLAAASGGCAARGPSLNQWVRRQGGIDVGNSGTERAQGVASRLAGGREGLQVSISVLASDAVSAFSWPNRRVFITRGLLDRVTDDELAAAIAHELGHLLEDRHVVATFSLGGCERGLDVEARADELGVKLLEMQGFAPDAMSRMLRKVEASHALPPSCHDAVEHRIKLLDARNRVPAAPARSHVPKVVDAG